MEDFDNVNALFCEPNAYIQRFDKSENKLDSNSPKKVVFQQPYDTVPYYYLKEDFKRPNKPKEQKERTNFLPFNLPIDVKNIMPMLSSFLGKGGGDLSNIVSALTSGNDSTNGTNMLMSLLNNKDLISNIFKMFKGGSFNAKKQNAFQNRRNKNSDFQIKNYTKIH